MIRFIVATTVAKRDVNGNCYNHSIVTSTKTGHQLKINSGWGSDGGNVKAMLREAGMEWEEFQYYESVVPIREYVRLMKNFAPFFLEHEVTSEMILGLEGETVPK